jgi:hypothetical protein
MSKEEWELVKSIATTQKAYAQALTSLSALVGVLAKEVIVLRKQVGT